MVRIPRRAHSVSGPPSMHSMLKDVACCCNIVKMHQFYMSVMELRRNPQRKCKREELPITSVSRHVEGGLPLSDNHEPCDSQHQMEPPSKIRRTTHRKSTPRQRVPHNIQEPFRFFDLPREVRDHVYSYLVLRRGIRRTAMIEAKPILKEQKRRANAQRTRERLNEKRVLSGKRPIIPRETVSEPQVYLNILQSSKLLHYEANDMLYQQNWFALSLDNLPSTTIETPPGWNFGRITKIQLELQLKDAQRMNSYIDWVNLFALFPALRILRIIPTFHPRYVDWAQAELDSWSTAHFIFKAFFRELLVSIPEHIRLKLGPSPDPSEDMQLDGKAPVAPSILWSMYAELGMRRHDDGTHLPVGEVVG